MRSVPFLEERGQLVRRVTRERLGGQVDSVTPRMMKEDVERGQEFRKCIECFLCQNTCHVVRDHEDNKHNFAGPRFFLRLRRARHAPARRRRRALWRLLCCSGCPARL